MILDARRHCHHKIGILAFAVFDPVFQQPFWLVISRQGPGKKPWYLLTSEPVYTPEQASLQNHPHLCQKVADRNVPQI